MRVISEHNCARHHRNSTYFARCVWPNLAEVSGHGFLAVVTTCGDPKVYLLERIRPAVMLRSELAVFGCGPQCQGSSEHELVGLDIDGSEEAA